MRPIMRMNQRCILGGLVLERHSLHSQAENGSITVPAPTEADGIEGIEREVEHIMEVEGMLQRASVPPF